MSTAVPSLTDIITKVRRLTRSPSQAQISDADITNYINTFVLFDFPEHLRLESLRTNYTFFLEPYIDTYSTTDPNSPVYGFAQQYLTTDKPLYVGGQQVLFSQSQEQFYGMYPLNNSIVMVAIGDGVTTSFSGVLPPGNGPVPPFTQPSVTVMPVLRNQVLFSSINGFNEGLSVYDDGNGNLIGDIADPTAPGTIDYVNRTYSFTYSSAPASNQFINSQTVPYQPSIPMAVLYFDDSFIFRPVPDQPYRVQVQVYVQPSQLLATGSTPQLYEWWQYIAYGAAKKIFEDRTDSDSVQGIMPEFKQQERLCLRRTLVQQTKNRSSTIYTEQTDIGASANGWGWGNGGYGS